MNENEKMNQKVRGAALRPLGRRRFLRGMAAAGAGLLAACAAQEIARQPTFAPTVTPFRLIESPQAPAQETDVQETAVQETGTVPQTGSEAGEGSISLEEFLQFSSLLTGVENLDPVLGQIYLNALQEGGGEGPTLADVYSAASSGSGPTPGNMEDLLGSGFFEQEGMGTTADQIISMWYTGTYRVGEEDRVATYVDALAWKVLTFTKPPTICAHFGFWAEAPRAEISPTIQYTPVPTQPAGSNGGGE